MIPPSLCNQTPTETMDVNKEDIQEVENAPGGAADVLAEDPATIKAEAVAGIHLEKRMGLWESAKTYRAACAWSMIASLSIIMEA